MTDQRFLIFCAISLLVGCGQSVSTTAPVSISGGNDGTVMLSVTSDPRQNPQSVDMAMKLAGFSVDEGRRVVIFFNVKGVTVPTNNLPDDLAFQEDTPLKEQLATLIQRGVDVHVCPICMKALGVNESDLIDGAKVTTRPSLFANIGSDTAVFTY